MSLRAVHVANANLSIQLHQELGQTIPGEKLDVLDRRRFLGLQRSVRFQRHSWIVVDMQAIHLGFLDGLYDPGFAVMFLWSPTMWRFGVHLDGYSRNANLTGP